MESLFSVSVPADLAGLNLSFVDILLRMLCAMAVGTVIGMEREYTHRPAGLRTHILVALGACAVMITGQLIFFQYSPLGSGADPARLAAQVISGVGFLGAGTILREGVNVKGLTTAASLWAVACLGIAAGAGYYHIALIGMVLMFLTLTALEVLQNLLMKGSRRNGSDYKLLCQDVGCAMNAMNAAAEACFCKLSGITVTNCDEGVCVHFHGEFGSGGRKRRQQRFAEILSADPAILSIQPIGQPVGTK